MQAKEMKQEGEITTNLGIYPADIREVLQEQGIEVTPENVQKVIQHLQGIARAWASACLQDEKDWRQWIED